MKLVPTAAFNRPILVLLAGLAWTSPASMQAAAQTVDDAAAPVPVERPDPEAAGEHRTLPEGRRIEGKIIPPVTEGRITPPVTTGKITPPSEAEGPMLPLPGAADGKILPPEDEEQPDVGEGFADVNATSADDPEAATPDIADVPLPARRPSSPAVAIMGTADADGSNEGDAGTETPADAGGADSGPATAASEVDVPPSNGLQSAAPTTEELKAATLEVTPEEAVRAAAAIEDAKVCEAELTARGVKFSVGTSISEGDCGVLRPVSVEALSSGVTVAPETQVLCRTALALDEWVTGSVAASAATNFDGAELSAIRTASSYVCRPRVGGAKVSEHARGSAVDIVTFVFDGGREVAVEAQAAGSPEATFQQEVRHAACGPFKTVLGPGSNADHATHFHFDLAARNNGATYCK